MLRNSFILSRKFQSIDQYRINEVGTKPNKISTSKQMVRSLTKTRLLINCNLMALKKSKALSHIKSLWRTFNLKKGKTIIDI